MRLSLVARTSTADGSRADSHRRWFATRIAERLDELANPLARHVPPKSDRGGRQRTPRLFGGRQKGGLELFADPSLVAVGFPSSVAYERQIGALARERPNDVGGLEDR